MKKSAFFTIVLFGTFLFAQTNTNLGEDWLDFWVGKWKLEWKDKDGNTGKGTNEIKKVLGNNVIYEKFEAKKGALKGFKGRSFSVLDAATGKWKQTWVDSQNSYLEFEGSQDGENKIFSRSFLNKEGDKILQRMVFTDITEKGFTWNWESSKDNGENWQRNWQIFYKKKLKKKKDKKSE